MVDMNTSSLTLTLSPHRRLTKLFTYDMNISSLTEKKLRKVRWNNRQQFIWTKKVVENSKVSAL